MADDLEAELLTYALAAHLPEQEPIMRWWRWARSKPTTALPKERELRLRAHDHALLAGRCEYHVRHDRGGWIEVRDYTDPRSMRSQFYQPDRPGQPYLPPHVEDR